MTDKDIVLVLLLGGFLIFVLPAIFAGVLCYVLGVGHDRDR